jgi:hypothetical protein
MKRKRKPVVKPVETSKRVYWTAEIPWSALLRRWRR